MSQSGRSWRGLLTPHPARNPTGCAGNTLVACEDAACRPRLRAEVGPEMRTLRLRSEPLPVHDHKGVVVKVVDVYGDESAVVKDLH